MTFETDFKRDGEATPHHVVFQSSSCNASAQLRNSTANMPVNIIADHSTASKTVRRVLDLFW